MKRIPQSSGRADNALLIGSTEPRLRVEIARSFSFKLNIGNYQSADFFMSQKAECDEADAEVVSEGLYQFCKSQVLKSVREFQEEKQFRRAS